MCVFSSHSFWTSSSLDVPAGVTQEEGHTGFLINLLSAVRALIFLARRIQPFISLVDREVILCTNDLIVLHPLGIIYFFSEKNPVCRDRTHVPTCQRLHGTSELPGRLCNSIVLLPCVMVYYVFSVLFLLFLWCSCMTINGSVQYNGGLLPNIILLTQCYFHRGTRLNAMKRFCICSLL